MLDFGITNDGFFSDDYGQGEASPGYERAEPTNEQAPKQDMPSRTVNGVTKYWDGKKWVD